MQTLHPQLKVNRRFMLSFLPPTDAPLRYAQSDPIFLINRSHQVGSDDSPFLATESLSSHIS